MTKFKIRPRPYSPSQSLLRSIFKVMDEHFGKDLSVSRKQLETIRAVAGVLQEIGDQAVQAKGKWNKCAK